MKIFFWELYIINPQTGTKQQLEVLPHESSPSFVMLLYFGVPNQEYMALHKDTYNH
jgi:hypothetical protein